MQKNRNQGNDKHTCDFWPQRLPRLVGKGLVLQLILSGEITAQEAYRIGLVNEIVPRDQLLPRAKAILQQIGANAPLAVKFAMEAVHKGLEGTLDEAC
jgi:enoyl-CoA hydratase